MKGIEVSLSAGTLRLECEPETLARLRQHLLSEPNLAEALGEMDRTAMTAVAVVVKRPPADQRIRATDLFRLGLVISAATFTGTAMILGFATMVRWLLGA